MAAGQGFKTFVTGEVLTSGDVNGYLMQGINVFTNATARDAAITAPAEGQFAFTKDNNSLWYYDGAAWVASGATGDIEGVTAGVGISGGGTSGTVTVTNSMATAIDAKGDLVPGTGADTFARLAVGANDTVLTADSSTATGLKWAAPAGGGGKVLQVVYNSYNLGVTTTSTSLVDTNLTATITPTSATSKILVVVSQNGCGKNATASGRLTLAIVRGATVLQYLADVAGYTNDAAINYFNNVSGTYLDAPATTSATTYKTQFLSEGGSTVFVNDTYANTYKSASTITLMEIGA
jgi:hypothetical protein